MRYKRSPKQSNYNTIDGGSKLLVSLALGAAKGLAGLAAIVAPLSQNFGCGGQRPAMVSTSDINSGLSSKKQKDYLDQFNANSPDYDYLVKDIKKEMGWNPEKLNANQRIYIVNLHYYYQRNLAKIKENFADGTYDSTLTRMRLKEGKLSPLQEIKVSGNHDLGNAVRDATKLPL